jgi:hypothetical protein
MTFQSLLRAAAFATLIVPTGSELAAQSLPAGPIRAFDGHVTVTGEITATFGDEDDIAFFNYTDYEHNVLRLFRLALSAAWRPTGRVAVVGEIRSEDLEQVRAFAAYVRVRPWLDRQFDIQVGRIPPTFGAFGRRAYTMDNPLIGYPLAYQYLTSLRADAIPATAEDLLRMRARGWLASYPVGATEAAQGVPLITAFRWDTGVQARWTNNYAEAIGAVTVGTLSDPQLSDNNTGPQVSGRVALHPVAGLIVGGSAARGEWLSSDVKALLPGDHHYPQTALGADVEYSRSYWLLRSELVWSRWRVPFALVEPSGADLGALGVWVEGR